MAYMAGHSKGGTALDDGQERPGSSLRYALKVIQEVLRGLSLWASDGSGPVFGGC